MRRNEKRIVDSGEIEDVLKRGKIIRVAFAHSEPYLLPLNYGYQDGIIFIHCAAEGKKLDIIKNDPRVFFEVTTDTELRQGDTACGYGFKYRCVLGKGRAAIALTDSEKLSGFNAIMKQQAGITAPVYDNEVMKRTLVFMIRIEELSGKKSGF
jgi:nitroimidazol reductase NimA-like FMN-containing flavoprotein (pyridoxamine 5'-phosphate oxidase superfamily)